jgi:hypothetical protein
MEEAVTPTQACGDVRRELGVYVVGAIAPADRPAVDSHLACCAACRDELAGLAGLPALLGRVPADDVDGLVRTGDDLPSDHCLELLLDRAAGGRRQRKWPWLVAAAMVGVLASGGAVAVSRMLPSAAHQSAAAADGTGASRAVNTVRATNPSTHASAVVKYSAQPWGLELYVQVTGVPVGTRCEFAVTSTGGQRSAAGSWIVAAGHQAAWYHESSAVSFSFVRSFVVTSGTRTLVTVPVPAAPTQKGDPG